MPSRPSPARRRPSCGSQTATARRVPLLLQIGTGRLLDRPPAAPPSAPELIGRDADMIEDISNAPHQDPRHVVGALTSLSLATVDTALSDLRCRRAGLPLYAVAGVPGDGRVFSTEGCGRSSPRPIWSRRRSRPGARLRGCKVKIGGHGPRRARDRSLRRPSAPGEVMTDAIGAHRR